MGVLGSQPSEEAGRPSELRVLQGGPPRRHLLLLHPRPPSSAPPSSSCAPTARGRGRSGSMDTSGSSARHSERASATPSLRTGSLPARNPNGCRRSATASRPSTCRRSSSAGSPPSRRRCRPRTAPPGTGGICRCARQRSRARWCSTPPAAPERSSKRSFRTTSASAARRRSPWPSPARPAARPTASPPGRLARHRRADRLPLQALARQAVPEGRPRAARGDRRSTSPRTSASRPACQTCPS